MGMTDKQFNNHIRMLQELIKEAKEEKDETEKDRKLQKLLDLLQTALED